MGVAELRRAVVNRISSASTDVGVALGRWIHMEIAKAVVLAGECGGSTLWPSVGVAARQLAPVANRPVLFHHLDALRSAGITEAAIVTDRTTGACIRGAVGDGSDWGLDLTHVEYHGTSNVLACSSFVGASPVVVQHGDVLLRERISALGDDFAEHELDALVLCPGTNTAHAAAGYILGPGVHQRLREDKFALNDVLQRLRVAGARIGVREVDACMPCRGGADDLLEANRRMLELLTRDAHGERVFDSEIQGLVALHPSAEVRASVVRGPVAIGPGARISNAYIGPYTSIGAGVDLDCVEIEHSIVLEGAQVRYLEARVEGSVIGPGARVSRDFRMPRALRLSVGEGSHVSFS
jgi:glucose-1-phosphate thymidylyltransferase